MPVNYNAPIEIRDGRNGNWFWIDKEIWSDERLTSADKVVYGSLAFYANKKDQTAFPSITSLQNNCKLSKRQIYISLKKLEALTHIKIDRKYGKPNQYTLLDNGISHLKQGGAEFAPVQNEEGRGAASALVGVQNEETNNIYINKNNLTKLNTNVLRAKPSFGNPEINTCLDELEKLLGNKPTKETLNRYAAKRLIVKLGGVDRVIKAINYAFLIRTEDKYAPQIYNYMDLEEKLERLKGYGRQKSKPRAVDVDSASKYLERKKISVNVD